MVFIFHLMDIAYIRQAGDDVIHYLNFTVVGSAILVCSPFDGNCIIFLSSMILSIV